MWPSVLLFWQGFLSGQLLPFNLAIVGSLLDSLGGFICGILETLFFLLPSSPVTMADLAVSIGDNLPFIGSAVIYYLFADIGQVLILVVAYKLFVILPGKFS